MARIAGVNIPTNKRVVIALQYIHGIGAKKAEEICEKVSIPADRRVVWTATDGWGPLCKMLDVPIPDDRDKDFRAPQIICNLYPRDRHESQPRILEFGRDQPGELALQLVVDASHAFPFHARLFRRGAAAVRFVAFFFGFACFASEAAAIDCFRICARRAAMTPTTASISSEASALLRSLRCIAGRTASLK